MRLNIDLLSNIFFFGIGPYMQDESYFTWTSENYNKSSFFDIKMSRNAPKANLFYTINKTDIKIVYFVDKQKKIVFTVGANTEIQSILLETLIEYLIGEFFAMFNDSLFTTYFGDVCHIFNSFNEVLENSLINYNDLGLFETALVECKGCKKNITIIIKKSLVENSKNPSTPIVYVHSGHALLVYVDKQFKIRGSSLVTISF